MFRGSNKICLLEWIAIMDSEKVPRLSSRS